MVQDHGTQEEDGEGIPTGAIVATAVAAGVIAFLIRRAVHNGPGSASPPVEPAAPPPEEPAAANLPRRTASVTREFLLERILPELKPILLDLLRDVKNYVDDGFKRLERAVGAL